MLHVNIHPAGNATNDFELIFDCYCSITAKKRQETPPWHVFAAEISLNLCAWLRDNTKRISWTRANTKEFYKLNEVKPMIVVQVHWGEVSDAPSIALQPKILLSAQPSSEILSAVA
jgi:hypothetical protein